VFQVRDARGQVSGYATVSRDITERKRGEEALHQAHQRLLYHTKNTPLAVIAFDSELRVSAWNEEARRVFGWEACEVLGTPMFEVPWLLAEDVPGIKAVAAGLYSGQTPRSVSPNRNVRKDGEVIWCEWYNSSLTDPSGKMQSIQSLVLEVTERQRAQQALARSKEELERLVAERTARLQELVGELEHFSYSITHDLKSPLRAMRGFAEMMSTTCGECDRTEAKEFLGRISTSAERMNHLIADALNYSRSLREELPLEDVDPGALLRGMLDSYPELQAEKAHIRVEERLPVVLANEAGLTQCFSNLLGNAVKFVKPGEKPEIRVWAESVADGQVGWVRIWVEDQGIGISKDMLPRVFDMFARGSKEYEGTGIGLALVRTVAQRMGGKVGAQSEQGKGSRFWIELKSGQARPAFAGATARQAESAAEGTVLYVEDEAGDAIFMELAFEEKGLGEKLRIVGTGRAAIDYLSGSDEFGDREKYPVPALVLLDLNLPELPGFGVLQWMRNHPDYARTPVVVFSSSTREDDQVKARELGANEFVAKPSSGMKFGEVVEGLRERWRV
jgi:PAS domain S-box-containing protein